jgi:hypothetical protein
MQITIGEGRKAMYVYTASRDAHDYASKGKYVLIYTLDFTRKYDEVATTSLLRRERTREKKADPTFTRKVRRVRCQCAA